MKELVDRAKTEITKAREDEIVAYVKRTLERISTLEESLAECRGQIVKVEAGNYSDVSTVPPPASYALPTPYAYPARVFQ